MSTMQTHMNENNGNKKHTTINKTRLVMN